MPDNEHERWVIPVTHKGALSQDGYRPGLGDREIEVVRADALRRAVEENERLQKELEQEKRSRGLEQADTARLEGMYERLRVAIADVARTPHELGADGRIAKAEKALNNVR